MAYIQITMIGYHNAWVMKNYTKYNVRYLIELYFDRQENGLSGHNCKIEHPLFCWSEQLKLLVFLLVLLRAQNWFQASI